MTSSVLDQLFFRKPIRQHIKEFGCVIGIVTLIVAAVLLKKDHALLETAIYVAMGGAVFTILAYVKPLILYPIWKGWMFLAEKMGAVMSVVILTVGWIVMVTPLSFILKMVGKETMDLRFRADVPSYWDKTKDTWQQGDFLKRQF